MEITCSHHLRDPKHHNIYFIYLSSLISIKQSYRKEKEHNVDIQKELVDVQRANVNPSSHVSSNQILNRFTTISTKNIACIRVKVHYISFWPYKKVY